MAVMSYPYATIQLTKKRKTKLEKYELEKMFKAKALASFNKDRMELMQLEAVDENDVGFVAYLEAIVFGMIPRAELESWIEYYEKKLAG